MKTTKKADAITAMLQVMAIAQGIPSATYESHISRALRSAAHRHIAYGGQMTPDAWYMDLTTDMDGKFITAYCSTRSGSVIMRRTDARNSARLLSRVNTILSPIN